MYQFGIKQFLYSISIYDKHHGQTVSAGVMNKINSCNNYKYLMTGM